MIDYINKNEYGYIFIVEDLIEFVYILQKCLINQCEVYCDMYGFNEVLCLVLCEDLDIILVGEFCDLEIICLVLIVVEIGYLVFGILYISLVVKIIDCIIDVFLVGEKLMVCLMLFEFLCVVILQVLLKKVGGGCIVVWEIMVGILVICNLICEDKVVQMYLVIQIGQQYGMMILDQYLQDLVKCSLIICNQVCEYVKDKCLFE